jgi:hypothetical protein
MDFTDDLWRSGVMGAYAGPNIAENGLVLALDAGNNSKSNLAGEYKNFVGAKIYSSYNGGLRSSNYSVQYSDNNSTWTTAFSGVASNNSSCGIQQNSGSGNGSYGVRRYWRYVEGSAIVSHHPMVSRIILTDINGIDKDYKIYTTDNCSNIGEYQVGTVSSFDSSLNTFIWIDLSGNGRTGTINNGVGYNSANGGSLTFDGVDDYIDAGNLGSFYSQGTISYWMNSSAVENYRNPFSTHYPNGNNIGIRFEQDSSGGFYVVIANNSQNYNVFNYVPGSSLLPNVWYNVVIVWNTSTNNATGYLNSVQKFNSSHTFWATNLPAISIGVGYDGSRFFKGNIAQVSIYNRALTATEIQQNFIATRSRYGI